jgi:hypothetical protein
MRLRKIADFEPDFPYDAVEEDDEFILLPGRNIAEAICDILRRLGLEVSTPEHTPPYGWRFDARSDRFRIWFQVTHLGEEVVLGTEDRSPLIGRLFGRTQQAYAGLLTGLSDELKADGRFRRLQWWDRYSARGIPADDPVIAR